MCNNTRKMQRIVSHIGAHRWYSARDLPIILSDVNMLIIHNEILE